MAYETNRFCWHGLISTDTDATTPFYAAVLNWGVQTVPFGDETATFFADSAGKNRAHTRAPEMEGEPSHWSSYLRVDDVDAAAVAATSNGGKVLVPGTDIPPGRFSVVASPSGAVFVLFHEADEAGAENAGDVEGGIHWVELHSTDIDADLAWLNASFGITSEAMEMGMGPYNILKSGETMIGGALAQQHEGAPSMWLPWVRIQDVDGAVERASASGGNVIAPLFEAPGVGRMSIIADPAGGVFGVIRPEAQHA
jgi:uncharacterized protein